MERPSFWKTHISEIEETMKGVKKGKARVITKSAGGRDVWMVEYGEKQDFNRRANYSSACGSRDPSCYAERKGKKPVIFIVGAVHGLELEGTASCLNMIKMIETGKDYAGNSIPFFSECIDKCRLLIIPLANPDGRARTPIDMFYGMSYEDFRHYGQGRWKDGSLCGWPECKKVHPIKDHVSYLGAYYNDDGINMMHDDFMGKMAKETRALFDICDAESPDFTMLLHGGGNTINEVCNSDFVPYTVKENIQTLKERVRAGANKRGLPTLVNKLNSETGDNTRRSFNLNVALHHHSGTIPVLYESNQGIVYGPEYKADPAWETLLTIEQILTKHYVLFEETIKYAMELAK